MNTVLMMRKVLLHPYEFYYEIQEPGRLKWSQGIILVLLAFVARMLSLVVTSYPFQTKEPYEISYIYEFIWIVVPFVTWTVANWGISAILDGEGKFKEVFVGGAFALVPYILFIVPIAFFTNLLSYSEQSVYTFLTAAVYCWVSWLILAKVKIVHDFEISKLILITLISLVGMAVIWFIGILMYGLANQFINFGIDLIKEIRFRM
ncbi:Yip1 family protein [Paenibacillus thermotolerans]|uniref:Yip1 family protein n=1 Tax=Paenibacillus thermotolerans TaxID=3027807 RepID=UPI002367DEA3|nr:MULTISPECIES: Yip1 family protein [unclassified Paenibacillus]